MNIARIGTDNIIRYGEYPFLHVQENEFLNVDLERDSNKLGNGLKKIGVKENDRVVVMLPNCPEILLSYQAILKLGAIVVPIHFASEFAELHLLLSECEPVAMITSYDLSATVQQVIHELDDKPEIILTGNIHGKSAQRMKGTSFEALLQAGEETLPIADRSGDDTAAIIYTSGTTGKPKGAMITHHNLYMDINLEPQAINLLSANGERVVDEDVIMTTLPLGHIYGLTIMLMAYVIGAKLVVLPAYDSVEVALAIEKYGVTSFTGVPDMYDQLANDHRLKSFELRSVKRWICGGASLPNETRQQFEARFHTQILESYGMTETTGGFSIQRTNRKMKPGSVGEIIPGCKARVVNNEGKILPVGQVGELIIKGPIVMKGYYKDQQATEKVLVNDWLYTGDMGFMDEDGDIFIVERKKDLIAYKNLTIYPTEVEAVLCKHPKVLHAGVIGILPHGENEVQIKAYVELQEDADVTIEEIQSFCRNYVADYKVPSIVEFRSELPKNELGKILRKKLREENDPLRTTGY